MVFEHQGEHKTQWAAIVSIASKVGCTGETLRKWVRQSERDQGQRDGLSSSERDRLKQLEREVRELKRANGEASVTCLDLLAMKIHHLIGATSQTSTPSSIRHRQVAES
jgi:transposase-like protein